MAFIGCPHLTYTQLESWSRKIVDGLRKNGKGKVQIKTILTTSPDVRMKFMKTPLYKDLIATGATVTSICPLMYTNNPITKLHRIATSSNKLRTYSIARYYKDNELLDLVLGNDKEVK